VVHGKGEKHVLVIMRKCIRGTLIPLNRIYSCPPYTRSLCNRLFK